MEVKNLWLITSLASSGPPPSLWTKTITPSTPTHQLTFFIQISVNTIISNVHARTLCCSLMTRIYQFLGTFILHFLTAYRCMCLPAGSTQCTNISMSPSVTWNTGLDQNNNQLCPCLWPLPYTKTNQKRSEGLNNVVCWTCGVPEHCGRWGRRYQKLIKH